MSAATFKVGTVFRHGSWLAPGPTITASDTARPRAICRVTMIRHGLVYYGFGADARQSRYIQSPEKLLANGAVILSPCVECDAELDPAAPTDDPGRCASCSQQARYDAAAAADAIPAPGSVYRVKVHAAGVRALENLLSHDPDLLVLHRDGGNDTTDGLITEADYRALVALLGNLQSPFRENV